MEGKSLSPAIYPDVVSTPSYNQRRTASPFGHKVLKKSLETIVSDSDSKKSPSLLENLISDKAKTLKASVNALLEEVGLRENLNVFHFRKIDGEISRLHSDLMNLENICDSHPFDLTGDLTEARFRIKADVLELERERRSEGIECWRDLMFLKKYLMGALKDYWELARRRGVLEGGGLKK
jgi:hypothetical protein